LLAFSFQYLQSFLLNLTFYLGAAHFGAFYYPFFLFDLDQKAYPIKQIMALENGSRQDVRWVE